MDYKSRLLSALHLLPLMRWFKLQDIMFLLKCLQQPTGNPEIANLVSSHSITRADQTGNKLKIKATSSMQTLLLLKNCAFLERHTIDLSKSFATIKRRVREHLIHNCIQKFDPENTCTIHFICLCSKRFA